MPRESKQAKRQRAAAIFAALSNAYPDAHCALSHRNPYELAVATILSAQCTDVRVNQVTPALFARYPTPEALAVADRAEVESLIRPTGFFRNKAKSLIGLAQAVVVDHDGRIPETMDELHALPGVGRKTANVILGNAFGKNEGVVVDTHIGRLSRRLKLSNHEAPERVERDLMDLYPQEVWTDLAHVLIFHGRRLCVARKPKCEACMVAELCPSAGMG